MIPRPNLGGGSIYTLYHDPFQVEAYFPREDPKLVVDVYAHNKRHAYVISLLPHCTLCLREVCIGGARVLTKTIGLSL